ncbi:MAG: hypothetical protein EBU90_06495 [Proteobacteria bacterium]|nr:hypothetical protein [Pseudomonadota bacterium]
MSDKKFHVAAMVGHEQLVLKLLLKNMVKHKTKEIMSKITEDQDNYLKAEVKFKEFSRLFNSYDDLTGSLPNYQNLDRTKTKLFYFTEHGIDFMLEAFRIYHDNFRYGLDFQDLQMIEESIERMEGLLNESRNYMYTSDEISRMFKLV